MTVTTSTLTRAAGLAAMASGLLFVAAQPVHPPDDLASVTGTAWATVHAMTFSMSILGLVGVSGIYLRQVGQAGVLGLVGYVLFALHYLFTAAFIFVELAVLPSVAPEAPLFVHSFLGIVSGAGGPVPLPAVKAVWVAVFALYLLGGVLLGIALFRADVLSRWAALLLAGGAASTLLIPVLPHEAARFAAMPVGLALVGLGWSLWSQRRLDDAGSVSAPNVAPVDLAVAE